MAKQRPPSKRAARDEDLKMAIARVHGENLSVRGADKVWSQLVREGIVGARCTVERLMRDLGRSGGRRGEASKVTTHADDSLHRPDALVDRAFTAIAPNGLGVADLTSVKTRSGRVRAACLRAPVAGGRGPHAHGRRQRPRQGDRARRAHTHRLTLTTPQVRRVVTVSRPVGGILSTPEGVGWPSI